MIAFVVDFWSAAAFLQVIALVVHCWHVLGLRIRRAVCAVALTVHTRVSEPLRHLELCGSAVLGFGFAVLLWKQLHLRLWIA